jgi:hypothetical protein
MPRERYDLDLPREELRDRVDEVVEHGLSQPFGLYVGGTDTVVGELARTVERVVFHESFGNTPEVLEREYGLYEPASLFYLAIDHRRRLPVGMMRCILPTPAGLKSVDDIRREWGEDVDALLTRTGIDLDQRPGWDTATIALLPDYRRGALRGLISMSLYQAAATAPRRLGFRWWFAILDVPVYRLLQWKLARPYSTYEGVEPGPYLGSEESIPVWCDLDEWSERVRRTDPDLFELVFSGTGIDAVVAPLDWAAVDLLVVRLVQDGLPRRAGAPAPTA